MSQAKSAEKMKVRKLLDDPLLLADRLCAAYRRWRRCRRLNGTPAAGLKAGQITTLELLELLRSFSPTPVYDIGAMVGKWSRLAKACLPSATLHAFEPLPAHHRAFEMSAAQLPGVTLHKVAAGARRGEMQLYVTSASAGSSLLPLASNTEALFGLRPERQELVPVVALDEYVEEHNIPPPDLIKLDVQGFELEALIGARRCVGSARFIIVEVSFVELYVGQALFRDIEDFCHTHGFRLYALGAGTRLGRELLQTDVLFLREDCIP